MDQKNQFRFLLYRAEAEDVSVNALVKDETIWLTQKAMAELFGIDKSGISRHIKNIFDTGELEENVVVAKIATTTQHGAISGKTQMSETTFYNLDVIMPLPTRLPPKLYMTRRIITRSIWGSLHGKTHRMAEFSSLMS